MYLATGVEVKSFLDSLKLCSNRENIQFTQMAKPPNHLKSFKEEGWVLCASCTASLP